MAQAKSKGTKLKVFSGREARLNRAVLDGLALKSKQTTYDLHKSFRNIRILKHVHYGNVNKRVRALREGGYLEEVDVKSTKAGFEATLYQLTEKAYLALAISSVSIEDLLQRVDKTEALSILAILAQLESNSGRKDGKKTNEKHA